MKKRSFADGGHALADEEGVELSKGMREKTYTRQSEAERWGRQVGTEHYPRAAKIQDSISNPVVRGLKKAGRYVKEKYGDLRDDVRTALTDDDSAGFRKGQRAVREKHMGYAKGGNVKKRKSTCKPGKPEVIRALMAAHQAGVQKGAMASQGGGGMPPPGPPGPPGAPPMGMKKGGFVPFAKKGAGKPGDKKEKWTPPWAKKGKKFAAGGRVGGGRGDGCATRGRTRGRMV